MAHWQATPDSWRRLFFGALGHGMQIVNLFEFRPVQVAYTENHVSHKETYATVLKSFRELGHIRAYCTGRASETGQNGALVQRNLRYMGR